MTTEDSQGPPKPAPATWWQHFVNATFLLEVIKQGQIFFIFCVFIVLATLAAVWGLPAGWREIKTFLEQQTGRYEKLSEEQKKALDETRKANQESATKFSDTVEDLIDEMKVGNDALKRFANAEEEENRQAEIERRVARGNP